jgi:hypothetical protein
MKDSEFFGSAASKPWFGVGSLPASGSHTSSAKVNLPDAVAEAKLLTSRYMEDASVSATGPLDRVTDPELREIMRSVLEEDADLIAYLRHR